MYLFSDPQPWCSGFLAMVHWCGTQVLSTMRKWLVTSRTTNEFLILVKCLLFFWEIFEVYMLSDCNNKIACLAACIDHRGTPEHPARTCTLEYSEGSLCVSRFWNYHFNPLWGHWCSFSILWRLKTQPIYTVVPYWFLNDLFTVVVHSFMVH